MDNFKILIRLLTKHGCRSDIAFNFVAESEAQALGAAARACMERADMMPTPGEISQLDITLSDCRSRMLELIRVRPEGLQARFERETSDELPCLTSFTLQPEDDEMFHLAAHCLQVETQARSSRVARTLS